MESKVRSLTAAQRAALSRIEGLMEYWRISADEIEFGSTGTSAPRKPKIKYQHPKTGETWDGQGAHPDWLRHALLKEGYMVSELAPSDSYAHNLN
jgi:DNA-binding protein H-NS